MSDNRHATRSPESALRNAVGGAWRRLVVAVCFAMTPTLLGVGIESAVAGDEQNSSCVATSCDTADLPRRTLGRPQYVGILPTLLYRVDTTPPMGANGAFEEGLNARGHGISVISHVLDGPPLGDVHSLIGLTASPIVASRLAEEARVAGTRLYIYTVRPSENYFNVDQSINWIDGNGVGNAADRDRVARARVEAVGLAQWVAFGAVIPEEIVEAREVTLPLNPNEDFRDQNLDEVVYRQLARQLPAGGHASPNLLTH